MNRTLPHHPLPTGFVQTIANLTGITDANVEHVAIALVKCLWTPAEIIASLTLTHSIAVGNASKTVYAETKLADDSSLQGIASNLYGETEKEFVRRLHIMRQQADAFQPPRLSADWLSYATWEGLEVRVTSDERNDGNVIITCGDAVKVLTPSEGLTFSGAIIIESATPQILHWSRSGGGLIGSVFKPVGAPMEKPSRVWPVQMNGPTVVEPIVTPEQEILQDVAPKLVAKRWSFFSRGKS